MYDDKRQILLQTGTHAAIDLTAAAVQTFGWLAVENVRATRIGIKITTATVSSGSIVINFRRRPTFASSSGQSSLGTITVPTAIAANKVYYKDITPVNMTEFDQVVVEVTTAAAGGGAAGQGVAFLVVDYDAETPANDSNMVASA